ncbi:MAG: AAA family ATPase [Proteobacteria bacterium]|nr:AAA family ATPase [Pseudomonadota bacterium]MBU1418887.1 AAA family ATPase [Pseudomonadota bacterium]MBU1455689.1 AAA family ATPase [Pseudomonadota bacterium]
MQQQSKKVWSSGLLLVFFGMIATGKSYLASAWAQQYGLPYYNSDRVRKELAGITPQTSQQAGVDQGIYTPAFSRRTYDALLDRADTHFREDAQACVVLDGSYQSARERELLRDRFSGRVDVLFVHCTCSEDVVKERLKQRAMDSHAVSDGRWEIYLAQRKRFQPVTDLEQEQVIELDTNAPLQQLLMQVGQHIQERGL